MLKYIQQLKFDWQKYKNDDKSALLKIVDFAWRKRYKEILFLLFIIGFYFIYNYSNNNDAISNTILFFTAIIVFWYTRETFDLKVLTRKELEETRKQTDFEMKPYLRMQISNNEHDIFKIVNCGRGLAIDIRFEKFIIENQKQEIGLLIKSRPLISPSNKGVTVVEYSELLDNIEGTLCAKAGIAPGNIKRVIMQNLNKNFLIKATYKDIEHNIYEVIFQADLSYNDRFRIIKQDKKLK